MGRGKKRQSGLGAKPQGHPAPLQPGAEAERDPKELRPPLLQGLEDKWGPVWEQEGVYRFDRSKERAQVFSIDTPPPTVSGSLHVGHVFSYTHTDLVARFQRMRGREVFYPMGWDDNGLPTERRVQNHFGVRCDPQLAYDPGFKAPAQPFSPPKPLSRRNFIELCLELTAEDEQAFEALWHQLGLSVDWSHCYSTIGPEAQRASQASFLRLFEKGLAYRAEAPAMWDTEFQTAVSQAEMEEREVPSQWVKVAFPLADGEVAIETTRPELLAACVAVVVHPADARYQRLVGAEATVPLYGRRVPILAHEAAAQQKGTGAVMVATFGDQQDVDWWRELALPTISAVTAQGTLEPPGDARAARELAGLSLEDARRRTIELLAEEGLLRGQPRSLTHAVKFYEKGSRPLEILVTPQWFLKSSEYKERLLARGREIEWQPEFMRTRYEDWVQGLRGDWCVSRQRFFGVPFPLWYPLDEEGYPDYARPLLPEPERLPVDPASAAPEGYDEAQRGKPLGFVADPDVMDTWATSSLSPRIAGGQGAGDDDLLGRVYPMDLRPQAHDIIRTWLFSTVLRAEMEEGQLPFAKAAISGWILDPDRKKLSKSKGHASTPQPFIDEYGADAVRYWAAKGRPGADTLLSFEPVKKGRIANRQMLVGQRLALKVLNASSFVDQKPTDDLAPEAAQDREFLHQLSDRLEQATAAFAALDYASALETVEEAFWGFCDDYLELVKPRFYGDLGEEEARSARRALHLGKDALLRALAPFLPYATEEAWRKTHASSIHRASWPMADELRFGDRSGALDLALQALEATRKAKAQAKLPHKAPCRLAVMLPKDKLDDWRAVEADVRAAANAEIELSEGELSLTAEA